MKKEIIFYSDASLLMAIGFQSEAHFLTMLREAINNKYPSYSIKYISSKAGSVSSLLERGKLIDIVVDSTGELIPKGKTNRFEMNLLEYYPHLKNDQTRLYKIPFTKCVYGFYYSVNFQKETDLSIKSLESWNDLINNLKDCSNHFSSKKYLLNTGHLSHTLRQLSLSYLDDDGETMSYLDSWKELTEFLKRAYSLPGNKPINNLALVFGGVGNFEMFPSMGHQVMRKFIENNIEYQCNAIPTFENKIGYPENGLNMYVNSTSRSIDIIIDCINIIISKEFQLQLFYQGVAPLERQDDSRKFGEHIDYLREVDTSVFFSRTPFNRNSLDALENEFEYLFWGPARKAYINHLFNQLSEETSLTQLKQAIEDTLTYVKQYQNN